MKKYSLLPLVLLFVSCASHTDMQHITLQDEDGRHPVQFWVEIADDPEEQSFGLMQRTELPEDQGMLFVFEKEQPLAFWMKNTLIPLDVLFFDEDRKFINGYTMDPCKADPCANYHSNDSAKYALELNAGTAKTYGIGNGWKFSLD